MKLTKYTHACIRLEKEGKVLVLDPGTFSESEEALSGAHAVLVTHEHNDHLDQPAVLTALRSNKVLELHAPAGVAEALQENEDVADRVHAVEPGSRFDVAGFNVRAFGGQHALIHHQIPVIANIGYLVDENVFHPGDSFVVPDGIEVRTLLVPIHAPWSKVGEVVDFVISVRAPKAFPVHDALLNELGRGIVEGHVTRIGARYGTRYERLAPGDAVEV
ncbi:MBL fold metallo-hydrolase [Paenarthrobacter aurescens]|uniref:MBL fold metallo-hydrolase n=1 Tax=Paenarthrobacter aurescens TaxID=43663 RepID=A0A4Y3ND87_PAEAU|nr:MBL fold metallo-hydrolase [Paenarthrobacter aurescens]UKA48454.1 MBL fold metallo-hydrolase [Arthrobacter sp. FW305-123]MDO6144052.1 MBL fold metallo-hydrolase [Paenarthrobacter aurescens]MDO6147899.1 MBL fold metallo-hydrolase [Paenarthrobacter aurescens]MDO6159143.1 MBL fold metallo-hydrolase [Paenarthrobacter aurescens]MDO6163127.1 MBL fold metallo-hydrolase [Paenarthrobacter aurescens]